MSPTLRQMWDELQGFATDARLMAQLLERDFKDADVAEISAALAKACDLIDRHRPKSEEEEAHEEEERRQAKYDDLVDDQIHARKNGDYD